MSSRSSRAGGSNRQNSANPEQNADKLFEPSVEMMVNDFDDERTLEEEEALAATEIEDPTAELSSLKKEGNMPIEQLLALYNFMPPHAPSTSSGSATKRTSRRSRGSTSVQSENTPSTSHTEATTSTASIEKVPASEPSISDAPNEDASAGSDANFANTTENKENTDDDDKKLIAKAIIDGDDKSKRNDDSDGTSIKTDPMDETDVKTESDNVEAVAAVESKTAELAPVSRDSDCAEMNDADDAEDDDDDEEEEESELRKLYPETFKTNEPRLLRATSRQNSDDEEEEGEDIDYSPEEDEFKKKIMVGSEFQAQIPEGLCRYDDALPYENEDKLVWDPSQLNECDIELYLKSVNVPVNVSNESNSTTSPNAATAPGTPKKSILPCGNHLRDDEQSLYLLLQCGHNTEEALRRRRLNATLPPVVAVAAATTASHQSPDNDTRMSLWSEEECRNFESGLRIFGKDFHAIQQSKVRTRSVSELVQFYYLWKKTERHDTFANKARLEKKKYSLHPGLTDYMDRFLEEQENNGMSGNASANNNPTSIMGTSHLNNSNNGSNNDRDRSISPVVNCLLFADYKRQRLSQTDVGSSLPLLSPSTSGSANTTKLLAASATLTNDSKSLHHSGKL